jgi:hypothetical protein
MNTSQSSVLEDISHLEQEIEVIDTLRIITKSNNYKRKYDPVKTRMRYESKKEYYRNANKTFREKNKEYFKAYREKNKERRRIYDLKYNAKRKIARIIEKHKDVA